MICLFVNASYRYTIDEYLRAWARSLGNRCRIVTYQSLPHRQVIRAGTFIFTDLERLTPTQCQAAESLAQRIEESGGRVLNRPVRLLRRFELLRALHDAGRNPFNVYRVDGSPIRCTFPVFIRDENQHSGPLTPLLHDENELTVALASLRQGTHRGASLLVVEYCETRTPGDGLYRKYSAMCVADELVPRHVLFSGQWVDKTPDVITDECIAEERTFLADFPHAAEVRAIFDLAGIEYGRIDYSCVDGRIVTWEINTNPVIVPLPEKCDLRRLEGQGRSARQISDALKTLDRPDVIVPLAKLPAIVEGHGRLGRAALASAARMWQVLGRMPLAGQAVRALRRSLDLAAQRA